jgi:hypothetical protein
LCFGRAARACVLCFCVLSRHNGPVFCVFVFWQTPLKTQGGANLLGLILGSVFASRAQQLSPFRHSSYLLLVSAIPFGLSFWPSGSITSQAPSPLELFTYLARRTSLQALSPRASLSPLATGASLARSDTSLAGVTFTPAQPHFTVNSLLGEKTNLKQKKPSRT